MIDTNNYACCIYRKNKKNVLCNLDAFLSVRIHAKLLRLAVYSTGFSSYIKTAFIHLQAYYGLII